MCYMILCKFEYRMFSQPYPLRQEFKQTVMSEEVKIGGKGKGGIEMEREEAVRKFSL